MLKMQNVTNGGVQYRGTDFPSTLLAKVVRADVPISVDDVSRDGDVKFSVPMRELGLNRTNMARTPLSRTVFFVNLLGELLVRKNIAEFARRLDSYEAKDYDTTVNCSKHRHFGMTIDEHDVLRFEFHISLVQRILTEDLGAAFDPS